MKLGDKSFVDEGTSLTWNMSSKEAKESQKVEQLEKLLAAEEFSEGEISYLLDQMRYHHFARGDSLMKRGAAADAVCVLLSGQLDAHMGPGRVLKVNPGELVGEVSFFKQQVNIVDVVGASEGVLCGLSFEAIQNAGRAKPGLAFSVMKWLGTAAIYKVAPQLGAQAAAAPGARKAAYVSEQVRSGAPPPPFPPSRSCRPPLHPP